MGASRSWPHLLAPGRIGTLELRNRIVMSPMGSNLAEADGRVGERIQRYYEERARGGVGLVIVGVGAVAFPAGACIPNQIGLSDDAFLPGLSELTRRVHAHGARVAIQLQHSGKVATQDIGAGRPLWVPSAASFTAGDLFADLTPQEIQRATAYLARPGAQVRFHEPTAAELRGLVARFAEAAERARRAGFDGVEIHAAHGYLLSSFLSPAANRREDEYGGSLENRARLLVEVIEAVKRRVGSDYPVWCRLDAKEFRVEHGITVEDSQPTAELCETAGADAIHVSAYADPTSGVAFTEAPLVHEPCGYVALAEGIKRRVGVPVIAVGRIEPEEAEEILRAGRADFVAMGRKLLADPELPRKLAEGRREDVRPCVYCYTCVGRIFQNEAVSCAANPAVGREAEFELEPAARPRRVLVVGGGPAGMEAARVAALRGHRVTLCERDRRLGGTLFLASLAHGPNGLLLEHLERQVRSLPVELRLGLEVTPAFVEELRPEVVLVAVGARRERPKIPGADRDHVFDGEELRGLLAGRIADGLARKISWGRRAVLGIGARLGVTASASLARKLSRRWLPFGRRIAIVGGGLVGVELARFLVERGRAVSVLEETGSLAAEMAIPRRWRALHELRQRGAVLLTEVRVEEIEEQAVVYVSKQGERRTAVADTVILATGASESRALADALAGLDVEVLLLGDCRGPGYVEGALADAARITRAL